ncbi:hypothetical protein BJF85_05350 [Saccharomonospora sp. CUA-673]|uniref:hypothetical protein n=1 Tax=Saccharomonospora sp. CUA-673 TaxID=1904969 RepID=UPI000968701E|nr:hypothetical protein [Saccharomonospora sp. CUA-673]OLT40593.1 hypothetical protein BJF85_05350 [Saccharomonospora sp. CUA-673]
MAATPGQTTITSGANGTRSVPSRVVPPVELPANVDELAADAAATLGWRGLVLPQLTMFGRRVYVVAKLRPAAHAERIALGQDPVTDRAQVSTWTWPEMADTAPQPAADIVGVLAVARHWRTGLAATVPFSRYGEAAMVLPQSMTLTHDYVDNCLPRARTYGVAVVSADDSAATDEDTEATGHVTLDVESHRDRILLGQDAVWRWINEVVYERLIAAENELDDTESDSAESDPAEESGATA